MSPALEGKVAIIARLKRDWERWYNHGLEHLLTEEI